MSWFYDGWTVAYVRSILVIMLKLWLFRWWRMIVVGRLRLNVMLVIV